MLSPRCVPVCSRSGMYHSRGVERRLCVGCLRRITNGGAPAGGVALGVVFVAVGHTFARFHFPKKKRCLKIYPTQRITPVGYSCRHYFQLSASNSALFVLCSPHRDSTHDQTLLLFSFLGRRGGRPDTSFTPPPSLTASVSRPAFLRAQTCERERKAKKST